MRAEIIRLKEERCYVTLKGIKDREVNIDIFSDTSFGNVEDGKTQIRFYVRLRERKGNTCPMSWKSKVGQKSDRIHLGS